MNKANEKEIEVLQLTMKSMEEDFQETLNLIKKQIEDLQTDSVKEPESGYYWALGDERASKQSIKDSWSKAGRVFSTEKQAGDTNTAVTESYMIAQYLYSKEPDYVPDWSNECLSKYRVVLNNKTGKYYVETNTYYSTQGCVLMPREVAKALVIELNNGTYSLKGFK